MNLAVIKKDDFAALQGWREQFFYKEDHRFTVNCTGHTQSRAQAYQAHRANRREIAFVIAGHLVKHSLAQRGPHILPCHCQVASHFVHEDALGGIQFACQTLELAAPLFIALFGEKALFFAANRVPLTLD